MAATTRVAPRDGKRTRQLVQYGVKPWSFLKWVSGLGVAHLAQRRGSFGFSAGAATAGEFFTFAMLKTLT